MTLELLLAGMVGALLALSFFLFNAWLVIRRLERDLDEESKERRELGYECQRREWESNKCFGLLGLKREPKREAEWVKVE